jgi:beta-lactamase family protein
LRQQSNPWFPRALRARHVLVALLADIAVLGAFFYVTLDRGDSSVSSALSPPAVQMMDGRAAAPAPAQDPWGLGVVKADIERIANTTSTDLGVAIVDSEGKMILNQDANRPFVLASVAKLYILAAYLDQVTADERGLSDTDVFLLQAMIRSSNNSAASALWTSIGEEEGLAAFLQSKDLDVVTTIEKGAWGTLNASAGQVGELLWQLADGRLLDQESTQMALTLLSDIEEDQAWGVSAGAMAFGNKVFLKNGWYPEEDGWRVNSAGLVETPADKYVLVVLAYPTPNMDEGITLIESIAGRINGYMAE